MYDLFDFHLINEEVMNEELIDDNEELIDDNEELIDDDDIYYTLGNYIYNYIQPEISGDIDMFKYILGKILLT